MRLRLSLRRATALSGSVRALVLRTERPEHVPYLPGQVVDLFVPRPGALPVKRAYSIASAPDREGPRSFAIAVTRVPGGPASNALHELVPGAVLDADGPRGSFVRWPALRELPTLFVAAGTGLAPFRAMLQEELARSDGPPIELLFGCRTPEDILWGDELREAAARAPRFRLTVTLSRPPPDWTGARGWVQAHVREALRFGPEVVWVCGLAAMVEGVQKELTQAGVFASRVRTETYDA